MHVLEGIWQPLAAELNGESAPAEVLQQTELTLTASTYTVRFGGEVADRGALLIENEIAHHLTLHGTAGPNAGRSIPCLFKFNHGTLTICFGLGGVRPTGFRTAPATQLYLVTYRRK